MKSSLNILRIWLLLFVFPAFYVNAGTLSIIGDINQESEYFQLETVVKDQPGNAEFNVPVRKNATPVIILTVLPFQGKIALLSWTSSDYSIPGTYNVERLDPSGLVVLKQLPYDTVLVYNDTISRPYCVATNITYQIRFISLSGLDNTTSPTENVFLSDQTAPKNVQNLNAGISLTRDPVITWTPVTGDDISGYMIQRDNGFSWDSITTVPVGSNQFIDNSVPNGCDKSYRYVVVTIDGCQISSAPIYEDVYVETIKLDASQPGACDKFSNLAWNSNNAMPGGGLGGYKIYRSDGITTVEIKDTQDTSYIDNFAFKNGTTYSYSVKAFSKDGLYSSSSCQPGWPYNGNIFPDTVYITQVTVEEDNLISIGYHYSPAGAVVKLILERSDDKGVSFHAIDSLPASIGFVPQDSFFNDTTVDVHSQSYYYRLVAIDDCGYKTPSLNVSNSIWLDCSYSESQNTLGWNSYEYWLQGVEGYKVYRILNGQPATIEMIGDVPTATQSYPDLLTGVDPTKPVCYWVEAAENPLNPYLTDAISKSNTCCIIKEPILFMPNAFHPEGVNKLFRPVPKPVYLDEQSFKMTVFDRWGQQLIESTDIVNGWNGTVNGQETPRGLYSYILTYKSLEGKEYTKRGTVLLVR